MSTESFDISSRLLWNHEVWDIVRTDRRPRWCTKKTSLCCNLGADHRDLIAAGYRVIAPDQIGFCKSSKPTDYQFTPKQLAGNTHQLLAELGI